MPPHTIIIGMPADIMSIMRRHISMNISWDMPSMGVIWQVMPVADISHFILHIIIGMGIIPPIIGICPIMGIMPPIMGIWGV